MSLESIQRQHVIDLVRSLVGGGLGNYDKVIQELRSLDKQWLIQVLAESLSDSDPDMRCNASTALCIIDSKRALGLIVPLLNDPDGIVRWHICGVLHDFGNQYVTPDLVRVLLEDPDASVRLQAASALERKGNSSAIPALRQVQQNDTGEDHDGNRVSIGAADAITAILSREQI